MSTSGNTAWELASTALVSASYRKLGYLGLGEALDSTSLANGVEALNAVVSFLETKGMPLWKRTTYPISLINGTNQYVLPEAAIKLPQVNIVSASTKWELLPKSLYDFNMLPPTSTGTPVHYTFAPNITNLQPTITVWPTPDATAVANYTLSAVYQKKFDGFFSSNDTLDFPHYWTQAIIYKLASSLAPETGLAIADRSQLMAEAEMAIKAASDYGDEDGSLFVQPDKR